MTVGAGGPAVDASAGPARPADTGVRRGGVEGTGNRARADVAALAGSTRAGAR
jgi:hypothetical protein